MSPVIYYFSGTGNSFWINYCPQQAIQIRSKFPITSRTEETDRYHHPSISYKDIAEQRLTLEIVT